MIEQPDTRPPDAQSTFQQTTQIPEAARPASATPSQKLVLPAVPPVPPGQLPTSGPLPPPIYTNPRVQVPPERLIRQNTPPPPGSPFAKLAYFWRKDPAYKVLMIAVVLVVVAAVVLTSLVSNAVLHGINAPQSGPVVQNPSGTVLPSGTVDDKPTFPTPGGGNGSTVTSQPPAQSTPVIGPTQPPQPGPTQPAVGLTVQITNIPGHVRNFSSANVSVNTSEADVQVSLVISYTASPYRGSAGPTMTGPDGNANLHWFIFVFSGGRQDVTATVYAVARDQNGQTARSQSAIVQITPQVGGGA